MKSSTQVAPELGVESYTYKRSRCLRLSASPFLILQMSLIDSLMVAGVSLCSSRARAAARPLLGFKNRIFTLTSFLRRQFIRAGPNFSSFLHSPCATPRRVHCFEVCPSHSHQLRGGTSRRDGQRPLIPKARNCWYISSADGLSSVTSPAAMTDVPTPIRKVDQYGYPL